MTAFLCRLLASRRGSRRRILATVALGAWALGMSLGHADHGGPAIVAARTGDDGDGHIDRITVTFSTPMDTSSAVLVSDGPGDPGIRIDGYQISAPPAWANPTTLLLTLVPGAAPDTGATPSVTYEGPNGGAKAASPVGLEADTGGPPALDGAGPALMAMYANDRGNAGLFRDLNDAVDIVFSERATLAGATKTDRWTNIERLIRFTNDGGGCTQDGIGVPSDFNFPQPSSNQVVDDDPITEPTAATDLEQVWHVVRRPQNLQPNHFFGGVPQGCWVGIDPNYNAVATDGAGNVSRHLNEADLPVRPRKTPIEPAPVRLVSAKTVDGRGGVPDGLLDALELTFDQSIEDATIDAQLPNIQISFGGLSATVNTSRDTGTPNDATFYVRFTGVQWHTGRTPTVGYVKPSDCAPSGGPGIKALVPTPGFRTCVASFELDTTDGAGPLLVSTTTLDTDGNGLIDVVRASFTELLAAGGAEGWTIDGRAASGFSLDGVDPTKADISFPEGGPAGDTGLLPAIVYDAQASGGTIDTVGNQVVETTQNAGTDGAPPRLRSAAVFDLDHDGRVERAVVEFSEGITDPATSEFTVDGRATTFAAPAAGDTDPDAANDRFISLVVPAIDGTDPKPVAYAPDAAPIVDTAGLAVPARAFAASAVSDLAQPVADVVVSPAAPMPAGTATVGAAYSEPMATDAAPPTATFAGKPLAPVADADHTNGWRNAAPGVWDATVEIVASDCATPTGCAVSALIADATDPAGNLQADPAGADSEIDTIAPEAAIPGAFTAVLAAGETAPADRINMFTESFSLPGTIVAGDAAGGRAELLLDGARMDPRALSPVISASQTAALPSTAFGAPEDLRAAVAEGSHGLTIGLCDDAGNCSTSIEHAVLADYTAVGISLTAPTGDLVVSGGEALRIAWDGDDAATGFDRVELGYSTDDGATWTGDISGAEPLDGSRDWVVPQIDAPRARVRAVTVDASGNKDYAPSDAFSIDSTAPVVTIDAPFDRFLSAGGQETIRWTVTDATIDRVTDPITIEFSTDDGATWAPINGGAYSKADDGQETWDVPDGVSYTTFVRVTARDATDRITTTVSTRQVKGVAGFVAERGGRIYAVGSALDDANLSYTSSSDWVRGMAMRRDGTQGFLVSRTGRLFGFSIGSAVKPASPSTTSLGGDYARDAVLRGDSTGYVLHADGRLFRFGSTPKPRVTKTWPGKDRARALVLLPNRKGGYVLDAYGRTYPFAIGWYPMPPTIQSSNLFTGPKAVDVVLRSNLRSGWILDAYGRTYAFGGAPSRASTGTGSGANAQALLQITEDSGYWLGGDGRFHAWGSAYGDPATRALGTDRARAAAAT